MKYEDEENEKLRIDRLKIEAIKSIISLFNDYNGDEILSLVSKITHKKTSEDTLRKIPNICNKLKEKIDKDFHTKPKESETIEEETARIFANIIGEAIDDAIVMTILNDLI
jgi:hypothetical protein